MRGSIQAALVLAAGVAFACEPSDAPRVPLSELGAPASSAPSTPADQHFRAGLEAAAEGRSEAAFRAFAAGLATDPDRSDILDARASLHLQLGQFAEALADSERAVALSPADPGFLSNRAQIYRRFGRAEEALADLDRALEFDPDFFAARFNRGTLRVELGRHEAALVDFDRCVALDPWAAPTYLNRAVTLQALGRVEEARRDVERFLGLDPEEAWREVAQQLLDELTGGT